MTTVYHYTSVMNLKSIWADQKIKVSKQEKLWGWRATTWFSRSETWEHSAGKAILNPDTNEAIFLTPEEQYEMLGMFRIGIELTDELTSWRKYRHVGRIPSNYYEDCEKIEKQTGSNPERDWYCSFENVPSKYWIKIEQYVDDRWVDISDCVEEALELFPKNELNSKVKLFFFDNY